MTAELRKLPVFTLNFLSTAAVLRHESGRLYSSPFLTYFFLSWTGRSSQGLERYGGSSLWRWRPALGCSANEEEVIQCTQCIIHFVVLGIVSRYPADIQNLLYCRCEKKGFCLNFVKNNRKWTVLRLHKEWRFLSSSKKKHCMCNKSK